MSLKDLQKEIKKRGLKQRWLADQIGIHPTTLSRYLTGKTNLSLPALKSLYRELQISEQAPTRAS